MKIAVNFYGQPRSPHNAHNIFSQTILDKKNEFKVLYTTWDEERIDQFQNLFPASFIRQVPVPPIESFKDEISKYQIDPTNPNKTIYGYLLSLYCKKESLKTIQLFEEIANVEFDLVITLRTDTILESNIFQNYYEDAKTRQDSAFVASEINHNVYGTGAYPDMFLLTSRKATRALNQIDMLEKCVVQGTNFFHPETSAFQCLVSNSLSVEFIEMTARVIGCSRNWFKNDQGLYELI